MKLETLLEADAVRDRDFRHMASELYDDIRDEIDYMADRRFHRVLVNFRSQKELDEAELGETPYIIDVAELLKRDDSYADFLLFIAPESDKSGGFGRLGREVSTREDRIVLLNGSRIYDTLRKMRERGDETTTSHRRFIRAVLRVEAIRTAFMHEYIHLMDDIRSNDYVSKGSEGTYQDSDDADYMNNPLELNAYFQESMDKMERAIKRDPYENQIELALTNFDMFKTFAFKFFRRDFLDHLTPSNRRRIEKRLYQAFVLYREEYDHTDES